MLARRNVRLLVAAQAVGGAAAPVIISVGGLVGQQLAAQPSLATLPVSLYTLGVALATLPAAWLMRRHGRRVAYLLGAAVGGTTGLLAAWAVMQSSFWLFCAALGLAGFYGACVQSYRFAAADAAPPAGRPLAISRVMVGGLVAAVIGPQLVIWTRDALPAAPFAGSFVGQGALALLALPLLWRLRAPPPAHPADNTAGTTAGDGTAEDMAGGPARPLRVIARQPAFVVAVVAGVVSYALMSLVMTATPIAMVGCGHSVGEAALGIQWHVLAMFAPSFFTGRLMDRFGKPAVTAAGLLLIALAGLLALAGLQLLHFWGALVLLGLGWNFGFIGATAMVVDCCRPAERPKAQALNDFIVFGTVAAASFGSGHLLTTAGWTTINLLVLPLVAAAVGLLVVAGPKRHVTA
ncbi:MAG: MFS transporter [Aquincola tertiaricarbonis]